MPETRQELEQQLVSHQREIKTNEDAIRETRKLLGKADKRLKANPAEKSKWGRTLDNLEDTLNEKKRLLTTSKTNIQKIERKLEQGKFVGGDSDINPETKPSTEESARGTEPLEVQENLSIDDLKNAVKRIVSTHIIKVHSISDLDFRLAKAFIFSKAAENLSHGETSELRKRLTILEKSRGSVPRIESVAPTPASEERVAEETPPKHIIQSVLKKCVLEDFDQITLEELEVLAKYSKALTFQSNNPKRSLLPMINDSLEIIRERINNLPFD